MEKIEDRAATSASAGLRPTLSTGRIIYMVVACAAPMASVMGAIPVAFGLGDGAGLPLTFVGVAAVLGLFAVGYTAMSRRVVSTGAFYTYVIQGLGRIPGLGAASVAVAEQAHVDIAANAHDIDLGDLVDRVQDLYHLPRNRQAHRSLPILDGQI